MTEIEYAYEVQGYRLPQGWTWEDVSSIREMRSIDPIYVPLATVRAGDDGQVTGWGVPMICGRFMDHSEAFVGNVMRIASPAYRRAEKQVSRVERQIRAEVR